MTLLSCIGGNVSLSFFPFSPSTLGDCRRHDENKSPVCFLSPSQKLMVTWYKPHGEQIIGPDLSQAQLKLPLK